jgi:hypothetical protein
VGGKRSKDSIEVTSEPLQDELIAIKDRLSAIETIQSISNAPAVKKFVEEHLTEKGKAIMKECAEARTKDHLISRFKFNSSQALDHHLQPLLKDDLLRRRREQDGTLVFEWSNLFRRLPHSTITAILKDAK